jgi:hypothetical protein
MNESSDSLEDKFECAAEMRVVRLRFWCLIVLVQNMLEMLDSIYVLE